MKTYYLAVDIGASSGRHMLGSVDNGRIELEEIYRFENGMTNKDGKLCWNIPHLFQEILEGIRQCKIVGKIPKSMGIDTWAVDYVLLDEEDEVLGHTYGYRDGRTNGMDDLVYDTISLEKLYQRTGIQKQVFNTIYQLMALKQQYPEQMEQAKTFLMLPDYFHFLLTGNKIAEYTNATSTQLVSPITKMWDQELIKMLGFNQSMFLPIAKPGEEVGMLAPDIAKKVGLSCMVVLPATHDTASAVLAMPVVGKEGLYISSGTWSLMGVELEKANCSLDSMQANFTNEGGYDYRYRFLKNVMGLWMIQSVRHELEDAYSFVKLCELAEKEKTFPSRVDVNATCFLSPDNMIETIKMYCETTNQTVPQSVGEIAAVIYQSLSDCYGETVKEIEQLSGKRFESIHIIGGGSNAGYLNQLTADKTGKTVFAGPAEATAIGNLAAQMMAAKEFENIEEVRTCIYHSFELKKYQ